MDDKDTQSNLQTHDTLSPEREQPPHGVPDGANDKKPKGLPDSERHQSESGPHQG